MPRATADNHVIIPSAPTAARVVFDHDVLRPQGWTLLNVLMDSRTGPGRFRDFRISTYQLMMQLIDWCTEHQGVGDVAVVDLRAEDVIHAGNRFMVYALSPQARVSVHVLTGKAGQNTVLALGRSILDRSSAVDLGAVALAHGGGHQAAGTCQVAHADAERVLAEVVGAARGEQAAALVRGADRAVRAGPVRAGPAGPRAGSAAEAHGGHDGRPGGA